MKKKYYDMTRKELENELNSSKKTEKRVSNISELSLVIGVLITFISLILFLTPQTNQISNFIMKNFLIRLSLGMVGICGYTIGIVGFMKMTSTAYRIHDINSRLYDMITMEYEKNRYSMEKKFENQNTNDITTNLNNRIDKINLLKEYKEELNNYQIFFDSKQISKEIDNQQYVINEMKSIQKVKK